MVPSTFRHFAQAEFACKCGCGRAAISPRLVAALEAIRAGLGDLPITINSGVRCEAHNAAVGGSPNSQHVYGNAADISVAGKTGAEIREAALSVPAIHGIGAAATWAHIDVRRGLMAQWRYDTADKVVAA